MARFTTLAEAIAAYVHDGDEVALEGFTHLIPHAAGHEIIRQGRRELTLIRMTPDIVYDQLIGAGCARKLVFSWGGNPGAGSLHRMRAAVERGQPHPLELDEHSHAGMATRYQAGASGLPFGVLRGYRGTDIAEVSSTIKWVECPFSGERLAAVPSLRPDVGIICAQQADHHGNVMMWGITGVQKETVLASSRSIVIVEEMVDSFVPRVNGQVLPAWALDAICVVPGAPHPSYSDGYSHRDNAFYAAWEPISRDPGLFATWIERHVLGTADHSGYLASIAEGG